jgi:preprotein translocase subunit SecD
MADEVQKETETEERSAVKEFLDAIPKEGDTDSLPTEKADETAPDSSTEKKDEKANQPVADKNDDENVPFHKHPRFKQLVEERKELKEKVDTYEQRLAQLESKASASAQSTEIPAWFVHLYGENAQAWSLYSDYTKAEKDRIKSEAVAEIQQEKSQAENRQREMDGWVSDNIQTLKDEGIKFDENKLLKVLVDYSPTDKAGNIDFRKGLDILDKLEKLEHIDAGKKTQAKKEIAASTTATAEGTSKGKTSLTAKQLRKMSWADLVDE